MELTLDRRNRFGRFIKKGKFSPRVFQRVYVRQRDNIEDVRILPPQLGGPDFGSMEVSFTVPVNDPEVASHRAGLGNLLRRPPNIIELSEATRVKRDKIAAVLRKRKSP